MREIREHNLKLTMREQIDRYELFCHPELDSGSHQRSRRILTHATTNLNTQKLE